MFEATSPRPKNISSKYPPIDSYWNDGGSACRSWYTYRGAAGVQDECHADRWGLDLQPRLSRSVAEFTTRAERPAVWSQYTTGCAINSVIGHCWLGWSLATCAGSIHYETHAAVPTANPVNNPPTVPLREVLVLD